MFQLDGRIALVTGSGQGVGVGIAQALLGQGAIIAVNDLVLERAEQTCALLTEGGDASKVVAAPFDVTDRDAVSAGVAAIEKAFGHPVDILVNNAGVPSDMRLGPFTQMDPNDWHRYIDLNVYGSLNCIHAVVNQMVGQGWGRVIQISSGAGRTGITLGVSLYGASKSGIEGFIRHLSQEVATTGVTANTVALGMMGTPAMQHSPYYSQMVAQVPVGRLGSAEDAGATVAFIASPEASFITGQTVNVNGGQIMN